MQHGGHGSGSIRKSHVGLALGVGITLLFVLSTLGLPLLRMVAPSAVVIVPLLGVSVFLLTLIWMVEEDAVGIAARDARLAPLAAECRRLGHVSLAYFVVFFALWVALDAIDPHLGWHHFVLTLLFLAWEFALAAYGYGLKRRVAALGGTPFWWTQRDAAAPEAERDPDPVVR